eukprot:TRINITY_DN6618_c0_g3_i1.p1 TRINITY_DN6618_c0_g3~~TRINITY_DN6618_c0_g3_i1.p1  ORF type:complete len:151 (+),score=39.34 TRINITY_DN6618_c0_g3_i1:60-455(+)
MCIRDSLCTAQSPGSSNVVVENLQLVPKTLTMGQPPSYQVKLKLVECPNAPLDMFTAFTYRTVFYFQGGNWVREYNYCFQDGDDWIILMDTGKTMSLKTTPPPAQGSAYSVYHEFKVFGSDRQISYTVYSL